MSRHVLEVMEDASGDLHWANADKRCAELREAREVVTELIEAAFAFRSVSQLPVSVMNARARRLDAALARCIGESP